MAWRWISASVIGTSHARRGDSLEDAYSVSELNNGGLFAVVSDGAGSAEFGKYGAWLVCRFLSIQFRDWVVDNPELPTDAELSEWIYELRSCIRDLANSRSTLPRQFAATLAAVVVAEDEVVTLHVGDSAIVGRNGKTWDVLCWPENGEYASSTYFYTDDPEPRLTINRHPRSYSAFALFTDGVGEFALSHVNEVAHDGFFDPVIRPVDEAAGDGRLVELSEKLAAYLAGPSVCERTDDDKTLILISEG